MASKPSQTTVAWLGGRNTDSFQWLCARIREAGFDLRTAEELASSATPVHRTILALDDRLSYTENASPFPESPTALALSGWWNGSGRTGLRELPTLAIPWYRWWETWLPWLCGEDANFFSPLPARSLQHAPGNPQRNVDWPFQEKKSLHVVCDCPYSRQAWESAAAQFCDRVTSSSWHQFERRYEPSSDWILWDDSCLSTSGPQHCDPRSEGVDLTTETCCQTLENIQRRHPESKIIMTLTMPRWSTYREVLKLGPVEFLTKPENGSGLARILMTGRH